MPGFGEEVCFGVGVWEKHLWFKAGWIERVLEGVYITIGDVGKFVKV
jgi:hypothetical protein